MKITLSAAVLVALLCSCSAYDKNNHKDAVESARDSNTAHPSDSTMVNGSRTDASFLVTAAAGGQLEVTLGKLAMATSQNDRVKAFGQMMVHDHTQAGDRVKALAQQNSILLADTLSDKQEHEVDELKTKVGGDFDRAYMNMMVDDHQDEIKDFRNEASGGKDADIKAMASATVPMLHTHLDSAKAIQRSLQP